MFTDRVMSGCHAAAMCDLLSLQYCLVLTQHCLFYVTSIIQTCLSHAVSSNIQPYKSIYLLI